MFIRNLYFLKRDVHGGYKSRSTGISTLTTWDRYLQHKKHLLYNMSSSPTKQNPSYPLSRPLGYYQTLEQGSQEWLEARKEFALTASEFGAALGLSKYKTAERLLHMKRNGMQETFSPFAQKFILGWGQNNEINAVESFEDHTGLRTRSCGLFPVESSGGQYLFAASPDRLVLDSDGTTVTHVLECKCPYTKKVYATILLKDCTIPNDHYIQVQAQLAATNLSEGFYVCWTPYHVAICLIKFDRELWTTYLRPQLETFATMASTTTTPTTATPATATTTQPSDPCTSRGRQMETGGSTSSTFREDEKKTAILPLIPKVPMALAVMKSQQRNTSLYKQVQSAPLSSFSPPPQQGTKRTTMSTPPKLPPKKRPSAEDTGRVTSTPPSSSSPYSKRSGTGSGTGPLRPSTTPPSQRSTLQPCST